MVRGQLLGIRGGCFGDGGWIMRGGDMCWGGEIILGVNWMELKE